MPVGWRTRWPTYAGHKHTMLIPTSGGFHYGRRNERYRSAHKLAILVLRGLAIADLFDSSSGRINAFMLNMNTVFEQFVSRLVANFLEGSRLEVSATSHSAQ